MNMSDNWKMRITFDTLTEQRRRDPELEFPNDEVSQVIQKITDLWGLLPEELKELAEWGDRHIVVAFEVLDNLHDLMSFILMQTTPQSLTIIRVDN